MTRKTAVGLCTFLIAVGCADRGDGSRSEHEASRTDTAAQVVASAGRTVTGPVRGSYDGKPFTAVVTVTEFVVRDGTLHAVGTLGSILGGLADATIDALEGQTLHFPVIIGPTVRPQVVIMSDAGFDAADGGLGAVCDVLYVRLAALSLDVLGLALALETVTLDINGEPGAGNLVGNLLCTVAGLVDPTSGLGGPTPANLQRSAELLNQVLDATAVSPDAGPEQPAIDAGRNPAVSIDGSVPIRF